MEKHNSCANSYAIIDYLEKWCPEKLDELFENLGPEMKGIIDPKAFLSDPNNWISSTLLIKLYANAKKILNEPDAAYHIGFRSIQQGKLGYITKFLLIAFGSPINIIKHLQRVNDHFNKTKKVEMLTGKSGYAEVRLIWDKNIPLSKDFCRMNKGIYEAIPMAFGSPPAKIEEPCCFFEGGEYCEYKISWKKKGVFQKFKDRFLVPYKVALESIDETEKDKSRLREKYNQVHALNLTLEDKLNQLTILQKTSQAVLSSWNLDQILNDCLNSLIKVVGLKRAGILLVGETKKEMTLIHAVGVDDIGLQKLKGYSVPFNKKDNIIARAARNKQGIFVNDVNDIKLNPNNILLKAFNPESFVVLPLIIKDQIAGILIGDSPGNKEFIKGIDKEFLSTFANQMAAIIEKLQLYQKLENSEHKYRNIVENAHDGIWLINEDGQISYNNKRACEVLGKKDIMGKNIYDLLDKKGKKKVVRILRENIDNRTAREEVEVIGEEGEIIKILLSSVPLFTGSLYEGSLMMAIDLTEKSRMEAKLLQAQKLESVGRMAGGIAHDFNNLLTGIIGNAQLLQSKIQNRKGDECRYADTILKTSFRAAELVADLLSFSRGTQSKSQETTQANYIIKDTQSLLESFISKNINLKSKLGQNLPPIRISATHLQQIITNLVLNARDAMPDGGDIIIETSIQKLESDQPAILKQGVTVIPGNYVCLIISDQGSGIPMEMQDKIFDPFFTTKEIGKGTGLGLAMVYGIMTGCGGCLNINSEPGVGTTFKLYFPIADRHTLKREEGDKERKNLSGTETILVVDDEPFVRDLALDILSPAGYKVLMAKNGVEAIHVYQAYKETIDLILLDLVMPKMNGKKVFDKIRAIDPDQKILVCSGYDTEEYYAQELIEKGAAFTPKPFKMHELLKQIRETLTPELKRSSS